MQAVLADACAINELLIVCVRGPPTEARSLASGCPPTSSAPAAAPPSPSRLSGSLSSLRCSSCTAPPCRRATRVGGENGGGASGRALAERVAELIPLAYKGDEIADFGEVLTLAMSSTAAHNHRAAASLAIMAVKSGGDHTKDLEILGSAALKTLLELPKTRPLLGCLLLLAFALADADIDRPSPQA